MAETRVLTAHVPVQLAEKVDDLANRLERPRGWIVKQALAAWIDQEEERHRLTLEGMADVKSQRVAWVVSGQQRPIMETGLSNLTQDASPALIHFADGQTQQWLMVRLPEPKQ